MLVNNAGLFSFSGGTDDGFETTFAVDYLAPFLLTNLLLDLLKASAPSRIVNVSSVGHFNGHIDLDAVRKGGVATGWGAYSNSKLALVMFTYESSHGGSRGRGSRRTVWTRAPWPPTSCGFRPPSRGRS